MSIVTTPEFAAYMGGWEYTGVQEQSAQLMLDGAQSDLERYLNRPVQMRRLLELATTGPDGLYWLRVTPVVGIHGIYEVDQESGLRGPAITELSSLRFIKSHNWIAFGGAGRQFYVDYTGGLNGDVDPGMKMAIMRVASREFGYKFDETVTVNNTEGRPAEDRPAPQPKGWTEDELKKFDRNRRRVVL